MSPRRPKEQRRDQINALCYRPATTMSETTLSLRPPSTGARSASDRYPLLPRFTKVHLILQDDERLREWRSPGSPPPVIVVHPHCYFADICLRADPVSISHHSDASQASPASSHMLVSKIRQASLSANLIKVKQQMAH